jgi:hypothetical protein
VLGRLPPYVHAYFHDYDLLDATRRVTLVIALLALRHRRLPGDARELSGASTR